MTIVFIILIALCLLLMVLNPKVKVIDLFKNRFRSLKNNRTKKIGIYDIACFYVLPMLLSIILVYYFKIIVSKEIIDNLITIYSIIFSLMLGIVTLLLSRNDKEKNNIINTISNETIYVSLSVVMYSFFISILLMINKLQYEKSDLYSVISMFVISLIIMSTMDILMIIKRLLKIIGGESIS